jgi:hypothetical protein
VHKALREPFGEPYATGDVIGLLLHMPPGGKRMEPGGSEVVVYKGASYTIEVRGRARARGPAPAAVAAALSATLRPCRRLRRALPAPSRAPPPCHPPLAPLLPLSSPLPPPPGQDDTEAKPLPGSGVAFTKNGALQGVAFSDICEGTYYPAASLYTRHRQAEGATVTFNFGPEFKHAPPRVEGWPDARPVCELAGAPPAAAGAAAGGGGGGGGGGGAPAPAAGTAATEAGGAPAPAPAAEANSGAAPAAPPQP